MCNTPLLSVVIPVYNAGPFLEEGLKSALQFEEVSEVVFVEDGSKDDSLEVLYNLEKRYSKVKVFRHPDKGNHGAGASRSLGLKMASSEWIAFLDADDIFLPNRFDIERETIFKNDDKTIDGIYGAIGAHYLNEESKKKYNLVFTTVSGVIPPDELKFVLLNMHKKYSGHFSLIATTLRRSLIHEIGYFATNVEPNEDTDMCIKLAFAGNLISGSIKEPISSRGVHMDNRITKVDYSHKLRLKEVLLENWKAWLEEKFPSESRALKNIERELNVVSFINDNQGMSMGKAITFFRKRPDVFFDNKKSELIIKAVLGRNTFGSFITKLKEKIVIAFFKSKVLKYDLYLN
ncbi:MAG: glycosyltransferase involved in cell wall biosynthesis [Chitinophagales bacterium]|jgi:glycosyltransferase involved in cell wall biosynthesis